MQDSTDHPRWKPGNPSGWPSLLLLAPTIWPNPVSGLLHPDSLQKPHIQPAQTPQQLPSPSSGDSSSLAATCAGNLVIFNFPFKFMVRWPPSSGPPPSQVSTLPTTPSRTRCESECQVQTPLPHISHIDHASVSSSAV